MKNRGRQRSQQLQRGFSLMEVVIATAILMGSAVVLSRLAGMGREQSQKAERYATAQRLCEQTLNEVLLGQRSVQPVEDQPLLPVIGWEQLAQDDLQNQSAADGLDALLPSQASNTAANPTNPNGPTNPDGTAIDESNPEWLYSLRSEPLPETPGMWAITIEVREAPSASEQESGKTTSRPIRFSLTRWIAGKPPTGAFDELQFRSSPDDSDGTDLSFPDSAAASSTGGQP